jgi:hypothetical protein
MRIGEACSKVTGESARPSGYGPRVFDLDDDFQLIEFIELGQQALPFDGSDLPPAMA